MERRADHQLPDAVSRWGWRFHHLGVPTPDRRPGERYIPALKMYVSGFRTSPYGVEWMRFEPDSPVHPVVRALPHLAFEVDDLDAALADKEILSPPSTPSAGVRVAMILHDGGPIEVMEIDGEPGE